MNQEAVIRAAYWMARALGRPTSRREINAIIKAVRGKQVRTDTIAAVLKAQKWDQNGTRTGPRLGPELKLKIQQNGTNLGTTTEPATLEDTDIEKRESDDSQASPMLFAVPDLPEAPQAPTAPSKPRPVLSPAKAAEYKLRDAFIAAIRPELEPTLRGVTWTRWREMNGRALGDMAKAGVTVDGFLAAWRAESAFHGSPAYSMDWVQKRLIRGEKAAPDPFDIIGNPDDPPTVSQLLAARGGPA